MASKTHTHTSKHMNTHTITRNRIHKKSEKDCKLYPQIDK